MACGGVLGRRLRFHHHTPQQAAVCLAFHQQAPDELGGNHLSGAGEEGWGEGWEFLSYGLDRIGTYQGETEQQLAIRASDYHNSRIVKGITQERVRRNRL